MEYKENEQEEEKYKNKKNENRVFNIYLDFLLLFCLETIKNVTTTENKNQIKNIKL